MALKVGSDVNKKEGRLHQLPFHQRSIGKQTKPFAACFRNFNLHTHKESRKVTVSPYHIEKTLFIIKNSRQRTTQRHTFAYFLSRSRWFPQTPPLAFATGQCCGSHSTHKARLIQPSPQPRVSSHCFFPSTETPSSGVTQEHT